MLTLALRALVVLAVAGLLTAADLAAASRPPVRAAGLDAPAEKEIAMD